MFNKNIKDITYEDIERLVDGKNPENIELDYKAQFNFSKNIDESRQEIAKDITALANTQGGYLLYGIKEEDNNSGIPSEIIGIDGNKGDEKIDDWLNKFMTNGGVTPKVHYYLQKVAIPDSEKIILIVEIPESTAKPHMVKFDQRSGNCYYKRFGTESKKADHYDVQQMFEFKTRFVQQFDEFKNKLHLTEGDEKIGQTKFSVKLCDAFTCKPTNQIMLVHFIPYNLNRNINFVRDTRFQEYIQRKYNINDSALVYLPNNELNSSGLIYNEYAIERVEERVVKNPYQYFLVYKNGAMEWARTDIIQTPSFGNSPSQPLISYHRFIHLVTTLLYHQIGLSSSIDSEQWNLQITLPNPNGAYLHYKEIYGRSSSQEPFGKDPIIIDVDYTTSQLNDTGIEDIITQVSDQIMAHAGLKVKFEDMKERLGYDSIGTSFK